MEASIVDLRYKSKEVLQALDRNEVVTVTYHGTVKGRIIPESASVKLNHVKEHPFFGLAPSGPSVESIMDRLRQPRY